MYCYSIGNTRRKVKTDQKVTFETPALVESLLGKLRYGRYVVVSLGIVFVLTTLISCGYEDKKIALSKAENTSASIGDAMPQKAPEVPAGQTLIQASMENKSKYMLSSYSKESLDKVRRKLEARQNTPAETYTYKVSKGDTLWSVAKRFRVDVDELARVNALAVNDALSIGRELKIVKAPVLVDYKVQAGESLWKIARKFGITIATIAESNGLGSEAQLQRGQVLKIKTFDESAVRM